MMDRQVELQKINEVVSMGEYFKKYQTKAVEPIRKTSYQVVKPIRELIRPIDAVKQMGDVLHITLYGTNRKMLLKGLFQYNVAQNGYITFVEIDQFLKLGKTIICTESKTGKDLTDVVLRKVLRDRASYQINCLTKEEVLEQVKKTNE